MSKTTKYSKFFAELKLTDEQGQSLVGALECIIESLLDKKYMLSAYEKENEQPEGGDILPRIH